ncbi:hypothetical protein Q7C30_010725 [Pseudomonas sp. RAC1]|uniref:hypothetical protein n=1 Tax=Pseudomonas sp. RAC1 TaxID=3064900 RepID=UPI002716C1F4|nr:hypothetical protein [Pseudomonas sp. RAC1]MDV9032570.1 hypothetical protein [Pseudomonas sp. RAC1]
MTSITAVQTLAPRVALAQPPTALTRAADTLTAAANVPSSTVSLGQPTIASEPQTYTRQGLLPGQTRYVWENDSQDKLATSLLTAFKTSSTAGRFNGIGAALIEQLVRNGGSGISQSVFAVSDDSPINPAVLKLQQTRLRENPDNGVSFSLTTASGATIRLSLASGEKGLAVSAEVDGGELSDDELRGLGKLADSFQSTIDGLKAQPPQLKLGALAKLDTTLFSSLQMNAKLQTPTGEQRFTLDLNERTRKLSLEGPTGEVRLSLDTHDGELLGSADQRKAAIANYLTQFDAAQRRGRADENLMGLFKDAFSQLNSLDDTRPTAVQKPFSMTDKDRALLSGLADFSASISETAQRNNPMRQDETDSFTFSASQQTDIQRQGLQDYSVQQRQQSKLDASFHQGANPLMALSLGSDRESQNYSYHVIDDQASSTTRLGFDKGKLVEASATQQASQKERILTYVNGDLKSDVTTPKAVTQSRNLQSLLKDAFEQERIAQRDRGDSVLEGLLQGQRSQWWLQTDPAKIAAG